MNFLQLATIVVVLSTTVLSQDYKCCIGDFDPNGVFVNTDRKWCCETCNCKDYDNNAILALGDSCCECPSPGSTAVPIENMRCCVGDYGWGGDGATLLNPTRKWCCNNCNCRRFLDSDWCAADNCCPPRFVVFKKPLITWTTAANNCYRAGMMLASINDAAENAEVWALIEAQSMSRAWIGLNDRRHEGWYRWLDRTRRRYTNWHSGQPNNGHGSEDCVEMSSHGGTAGKWNDVSCYATFVDGYVCAVL